MDIVIGKTSLETEETRLVASLDKHETAVLVLGINRVDVRYEDGGWRISCNNNIEVDQTQSDDRFVAPRTDLHQV